MQEKKKEIRIQATGVVSEALCCIIFGQVNILHRAALKNVMTLK